MGRLMAGVNDLLTLNPGLAQEWHPDRNGDLLPQDVTGRSSRKVWWRGTCGHDWDASVGNRWTGSGCPFCSPVGRKRVLAGFNDLATLHPELVPQWHPSNDLSPSDITAGSKKRVSWLCDLGHEWVTSVNNRTSNSTGCPFCSGNLLAPGADTLATTNPELVQQWSPLNNLSPSEVSPMSGYRGHWVCAKGHEWSARVADRAGYGTGCPLCPVTWDQSRSGVEKGLESFVTSLGVKVEASNRTVIYPKELDLLLPDESLAIEFNGLYWHSEARKSRSYHFDKSVAAERAGLQLIHIWEDDWRDRREVVERMLARKIGVSSEKRLNGRGMEVRPVCISVARDFLDENHIQGYSSGSVRMGLHEGDLLRAVMIFRSRGEGTWELSRFATSAIVRGGFSKLLKAFKDQYVPGRIVSFSDRGVSDGGIYEASGFVRDGEIPPDYSYVVRGRRVHKFNYRKSRFKSDPNLKFEEGLTERQLADLNGLLRVYDAGKTRWVWTR